ncbi:MAG TPA: non-lysosomal glucosylceramidase [Candidatus Angelobacter sp.]|nr:non-lysosomal glucosylceramidase [Candidatus Angelobacter sp.]
MIPQAAWRRPIGQPLSTALGKKPEIKVMIDDGYWQGAPVGGFGAGTFSRSYRGDFVRWHMKAGIHKYQSIPANQFSVFVKPEGGKAIAEVLCAGMPKSDGLSTWNWSYPAGSGEYAALYPKAWFDYHSQELPVHLVLEQFSPVLPDNYKESSYPVALYNWYASNDTQQTETVSIMFSWTNMVGWFRDTSSNFDNVINAQNTNHFRSQPMQNGAMKGIVFDRVRSNNVVQEEWDGQFAIAALETPGVEVSYVNTFLPQSDGSEVWKPFSTTGTLPNTNQSFATSDEQLAGAIAVKFTLRPGEKKIIPMVLSWDLPVIEFGMGRKWLRRYTDFFGTSGTHAWDIAATGLREDQNWSRQIDDWQAKYVNDNSKPAWYRGMLFNEMYILADGGTVWAHELKGRNTDRGPNAEMVHDPKLGIRESSFSYLECFDYAYYGTLDVRFYGSMPLVKFWPEIDKQEVREFAATVPEQDTEKYLWRWKLIFEHETELMQRKVAGALPHDLGNPVEDPFAAANQYQWQDSTHWKDLNTKFVLLVWRDYALTGRQDTKFLKETYDSVKQAMKYMQQFDTDHDGLIENGGFPDQTYDVWVTRGASAYSGGLYLAALRATQEIAQSLGDTSTAQEYKDLFQRAQASYIRKLWNGEYFNYDVSSPYHTNIMADQLAGQWYANLTGLGDLVPQKMRQSAMRKVFDFNVKKFANGELGALNGMSTDGTPLTINEQVQEVWTGTTFAVASEMMAEGMVQEGYATAKGIYNGVYERFGYWFRTPEAWGLDGHYRAGMYMRPGAIWSMEIVNEQQGKSPVQASGGQK